MPTGRVVDAAGVLSPTVEAELAGLLQQLDDQTSVQIALVTVPTLGGLPVGAYSLRLMQEWGVGQVGLNNGALVLVAPTEREVQIQVGSGLEWQIPDTEAREVVQQMTRHFQTGDYEAGLKVGMALLGREAMSVPWDVRYGSVGALPMPRARALGAVMAVRGTLADDGATVWAEGEPVRLLYPPYWFAVRDADAADGTTVALMGRVASVAPLTVQVLGRAE